MGRAGEELKGLVQDAGGLDAAGELANITGGSVKTLLAPTCSLSLPSVVMGRDYEFSVDILKLLGAKKIRLLSNNPEKVRQLENSGIRVVQRVPCQPRISKISRAYMQTKKVKMGHILDGL